MIFAYLLFIKILFKGIQLGFNIMNRISPVLELLFLHVPGKTPTILIIKPCQKFIFSYIYVIYKGTLDQYSLVNSPLHRRYYKSYTEPYTFFGYSTNTTTCLYIATYRYGQFIVSPYGSKTYIFLDSFLSDSEKKILLS